MNKLFTKKISFEDGLKLLDSPRFEIGTTFKKWAVGSTVGENSIYRVHKKHTQYKNDFYLLVFADFDALSLTLTNDPETIKKFKYKVDLNENRFK